ncbi:MAG: hypothetical protein GY732_00865 [Gammaproteobacteria bacterium]|nr:hypothetical protein [Gammaproteobacteria bacterium]
MKQLEMPFKNDADHPAEILVMNDEQKQQLLALMAQAISMVLKPQLGDDDGPS